MTKSDTPLKYISIERALRDIRKPEWAENKEIVAFDSETKDGDIFMITTSSPEKTFIYEDNANILEPERIFDIVTQKYFRNTLNVWFNLGFDAEVILKVLPEDKLKRLQVLNVVEWNNYRIKYLPNKFLRIETGISNVEDSDRNFQNSVQYFDVAQLFRNNLQGAVNEWLTDKNLQKNQQDIDVERFNDINYIRDNYEKICEYAKHDAKLTRLITEKLIRIAEDIGIPCAKPFSTGYLAESYLKNTLSQKPGWGPKEMQSMAWESYAGGRFEVFKRGNIGKVVGPDINSAYPAIMKDLPDPSTLQWHYYHEKESIPTESQLIEADYGFITAEITTDKSKPIQPFAVKMDKIVKYPALDNYNITVLKDIFVWALQHGYIQDYNIERAFLGYETSNTIKPFDFFPELYKQRKQWEDRDKYRRAWLLKIILNSMYGKTAQTQYKKELVQDTANIEDIPEGIEMSAGPDNEIPHLKRQESGSLFNPFLATYITGLTRLELHKAVERYDLIDNTILFATDSTMVDSKAYHNSNFSELEADKDTSYQDQLGMWDFDYEGEAFVIGSGVYEVRLADSDKIKMATRGFRESKIDSFKEAAKEAGTDPIAIEHNRPRTLGEAIHQKKLGNRDIGKFFKGKRDLKPGFDNKRDWAIQVDTWHDLLSDSHGSEPLSISE